MDVKIIKNRIKIWFKKIKHWFYALLIIIAVVGMVREIVFNPREADDNFEYLYVAYDTGQPIVEARQWSVSFQPSVDTGAIRLYTGESFNEIIEGTNQNPRDLSPEALALLDNPKFKEGLENLAKLNQEISKLEEEVKIKETHKEKLEEKIDNLREEKEEVLGVTTKQVEAIKKVLDKDKRKDFVRNIAIALFVSIMVNFAFINRHIRKWAYEYFISLPEEKSLSTKQSPEGNRIVPK